MTAKEFQSIRKSKGLRQKDVAAILGRSRTMISLWETGKAPLPKYAQVWLRAY